MSKDCRNRNGVEGYIVPAGCSLFFSPFPALPPPLPVAHLSSLRPSQLHRSTSSGGLQDILRSGEEFGPSPSSKNLIIVVISRGRTEDIPFSRHPHRPLCHHRFASATGNVLSAPPQTNRPTQQIKSLSTRRYSLLPVACIFKSFGGHQPHAIPLHPTLRDSPFPIRPLEPRIVHPLSNRFSTSSSAPELLR
ncbi:hypothetical protein ZHAS_00006718 [Anopheles sinensis]|uniref:Uncharacterized protein n=1 Tax=Anopheles sinensis TaxID=74873 RepID=A0A084VM16_ANOSI|nr:hypothetical protein ZHAS_00006718 [Anopheles sinensis]